MAPEAEHGTLVGSTLGGYLLLGLLGYGGMAEVYRAREPEIGRQVAVKVLPAHLAHDPGYVARFRTEARRGAALNHPNIVPLYAYGEERGLLYLVMPVLAESLRDRIEREGSLAPRDAVRLATQVAKGLGAAHTQGLLHRDVKPENILLDADGHAQLTDFGIARDLESLRDSGVQWTLATTGLPIGTPEYMAPEQLDGLAADQRVDVYALGVVLYEMVTGQVPFEADHPRQVAHLVLTRAPVPPSVRNPEVWPELEAVVLTAMAKRPDDRYRDMASFSHALRRSMLVPARESEQLAVAPTGWELSERELRLAEAGSVYAEGLIAPEWGDGGAGALARAHTLETGAARAPRRAERKSPRRALVALAALVALGALLLLVLAFALVR